METRLTARESRLRETYLPNTLPAPWGNATVSTNTCKVAQCKLLCSLFTGEIVNLNLNTLYRSAVTYPKQEMQYYIRKQGST